MVNRDYTQELGLKPNATVVPLPIAIAILALGGAVMWFGVSMLNRAHPSHRASSDTTEASTAKPASPRTATGG